MVNPAVEKQFGFLPSVTYRHLMRWNLDDQSRQRRHLRARKSLFWSEFSNYSLLSVYLRESNAPVFAEVITCQKPPDGDLDEDQYVVSRC